MKMENLSMPRHFQGFEYYTLLECKMQDVRSRKDKRGTTQPAASSERNRNMDRKGHS
jgi:hypothetical protein